MRRRPNLKTRSCFFALPTTDQAPHSAPAYQAALLTLQLGSAVAAADGRFDASELRHLRKQVESWSHLTSNHQRRLLAHLRLLSEVPASLPALKKKIEPFDQLTRETMAAFMATVAQADGTVSPVEVKLLEKIYKALGVDPKKVFSDVHAVTAGVAPAIGEQEKVERTGFKLDPARISALQRDTERVSALLANIFTEEDPSSHVAASSVIEQELDAEQQSAPAGLLGLDEAHSALARLLLGQTAWSRAELEDAAADLELMLDGALEHINEASFDKFDIPFTEKNDDPVTVNPELLEKIDA